MSLVTLIYVGLPFYSAAAVSISKHKGRFNAAQTLPQESVSRRSA